MEFSYDGDARGRRPVKKGWYFTFVCLNWRRSFQYACRSKILLKLNLQWERLRNVQRFKTHVHSFCVAREIPLFGDVLDVAVLRFAKLPNSCARAFWIFVNSLAVPITTKRNNNVEWTVLGVLENANRSGYFCVIFPFNWALSLHI